MNGCCPAETAPLTGTCETASMFRSCVCAEAGMGWPVLLCRSVLWYLVVGVWPGGVRARPLALPASLCCAPGLRKEYPNGARVSASEALSG
jgi:hypothetical protein